MLSILRSDVIEIIHTEKYEICIYAAKGGLICTIILNGITIARADFRDNTSSLVKPYSYVVDFIRIYVKGFRNEK